ncbi:MAG: UbiH/UbiF/VisC/COQ6 family ubiquinone biosynthesis hydroxylase [Alphaproteobacteria bacterium]|nr:UbiH/UbiF/VisC/COQ6 family ubiquinone biosynthesis hydroxylase [Alphaproteobacteria bacterium]
MTRKKIKSYPTDAAYDVIIIGGGLSGLSFAAGLGGAGISVLCIEREDPAHMATQSYDDRTIAISLGSYRVLEQFGITHFLSDNDMCPIRHIDISEGSSPVLLNFLSHDIDIDAFGYIIENRFLRRALYQKIESLDSVHLLSSTHVVDFEILSDHVQVKTSSGACFSAKLVVGADGRSSFTREWMNIGVREWSYRQSAHVCMMAHEHPHHFTAVENFRPEGPFAILPMPDDENGRHRSAVVWSRHHRKKIKNLENIGIFEAGLQALVPTSYGRIEVISKPVLYPLGFVHAHRYTGTRMALIADAAHGIHPIAGQGLNLGFRDMSALYQLIISAHKQGRDIGASALLSTYEQKRRFDNMMMSAATDTLNKLFAHPSKSFGLIRKAGLKMIQSVKPAKRFLMKYASGL